MESSLCCFCFIYHISLDLVLSFFVSVHIFYDHVGSCKCIPGLWRDVHSEIWSRLPFQPTPAGSRWSICFFFMLPAWIPKVSLDLLDPWKPVDDTCDWWGSWRSQGPCCHYVRQHCLRHLWKRYFFGVHWYLCWVWILPCICVKGFLNQICGLLRLDGKTYGERRLQISRPWYVCSSLYTSSVFVQLKLWNLG